MSNDPVSVFAGENEVASTMTAGDGSFKFTLPAGEYVIVMPCGETRLSATVSPGATVRKDFTCQAV